MTTKRKPPVDFSPRGPLGACGPVVSQALALLTELEQLPTVSRELAERRAQINRAAKRALAAAASRDPETARALKRRAAAKLARSR